MIKQRGAAILIALIIASIVALTAVRMGTAYELSFRRVSNATLSDQATLYLVSAESIAKQLLLADPDLNMDFAGEAWADTYPPLPIGVGMLAPQPMVDLQGRLNLNALQSAVPTQAGTPAPRTPVQKIFVRLVQTFPSVQLSPTEAEDLTSAISDWIDDNQSPEGFGGAEDTYYTALDVPYRSADTYMQSVSELRLIKGITPELYAALEPHVAVMDPSVSKININAATPNILRALASNDPSGLTPLDETEIESYLAGVDPAIGLSTNNFFSYPPWQTLVTVNGVVADELKNAVVSNTEYFELTTHASLGELTIPMRTVLRREHGQSHKVSVISRSTGSL